MQIHFTGHHVEVTSALRTFTQEKLNKLDKHFDNITDIHVIFNVEKLIQRVEASVMVTKAKIHASAESDDMYTAIDELVHKLNAQLIKHKEKHLSHRE